MTTRQRHPITPVMHPTLVHDFYEPDEVEALFGIVRRHAPWKLVLAHHFKSTEEYLAVSGGAGVDPAEVSLSDFIAPVFRDYLAEEGVVFYPEVHDLYFSKKLLDPVKEMHGAKYGLALHMLFNTGVPSHSFDAGHFDSANWRGCSIVNTPIWLLSVMAKSGLFDHWAVKTGQMITYFYNSDIDGGFTYWPDGPDLPPRRFKAPFDNTCILSDNSKMYHRRESNGPAHQRDHPDIRLESLLHSEDPDHWVVRNGDREIARYRDRDMRTLFHYTALVFDELSDVRTYLDRTDDLTHEKVFEVLVHDLRRRGVKFTEPTDPMTDPEFIALLNKTYEMAPREYPAAAPPAVRGAA
ncbi:hypothetical protein [Actinomadura sp. CNU-125]|uniref:hypothetical protein n=1 Tax=Actinomadura sp. CNU-125 TaxID=1904961 RepID=UPI000A4919A5|nr:hypothetical protein [Actinomadura sp. CNU-125]